MQEIGTKSITGADFQYMLSRYGLSLRAFSLQNKRSEKYYQTILARYGREPIPIKHLHTLENFIGSKNFKILLEELAERKKKQQEQAEARQKKSSKPGSAGGSATASPTVTYDEGTIIDENGVPVAAWSYYKPCKGKRKPITKPFDFGLTDEELESKIDFGDLI